MNELQRIKAGELAIALSRGFADLPEAVEWADRQISLVEEPENLLIDLALTQSTPDAISYLNSLSSGVDFWFSVSSFLNRFYALKHMSPESALNLAEYLYNLAGREDAPTYFKRFISHWDAIGLAIEGTYGDPNESIADFLNDIRKSMKTARGLP